MRSDLKNWWEKLGKWQVVMMIVALAAFFITLSFTGDVKKAATVAVATVAVATVATVAVAIIIADDPVLTIAAALVAVAAVVTAVITVTAVAIATATIAVAAVIAAVINSKNSRGIVFFSLLGEFIVILLPMLGTILHWH